MISSAVEVFWVNIVVLDIWVEKGSVGVIYLATYAVSEVGAAMSGSGRVGRIQLVERKCGLKLRIGQDVEYE